MRCIEHEHGDLEIQLVARQAASVFLYNGCEVFTLICLNDWSYERTAPILYQLRSPVDNIWAMMFGSKMGFYQNCSVLYCVPVLKLWSVISTLRWEVLTFLWIGFCHTGPISLCVDSFVWIHSSLCILCVFHTVYLLYYCEHSGVDLMGLKP